MQYFLLSVAFAVSRYPKFVTLALILRSVFHFTCVLRLLPLMHILNQHSLSLPIQHAWLLSCSFFYIICPSNNRRPDVHDENEAVPLLLLSNLFVHILSNRLGWFQLFRIFILYPSFEAER